MKTNREIIEWLFEQFKQNGVEKDNFDDFLDDEQTIQFFRENGLTKKSYNKYCKKYLYWDGLDDAARMLIDDLCWR